MRKGLALLAALVGFACIVPSIPAQSDDGLLPVEQAFKLDATIPAPGQTRLHWDIAPGYYLYRQRIHVETTSKDVTLGALALPAGEPKHDEFLGDMEVYHHAVDATQPFTAAAGATMLDLAISVQGCHELPPQVCYPPHVTKVSLALPVSSNAPPPVAKTGILRLGSDAGLINGPTSSEPLPPDQAFVFEAIAESPTSILARWIMPPGYYLYRDKSSVRLGDGADAKLGVPHWPRGQSHSDEHFGTVEVYFNEVELPIPLERASGHAETLALTAEYQGCQDNGLCYPVMTKTVKVEMPTATPAQLAAARATFVAAPVASPTVGPPSAAGSIAATGQSDEQRLAGNLASGGWLALLSFFGFGLLLAFTPCVFPMIPILSGIIAGSGATMSTRRAFWLSLVYVLATCVVFTIAGIVAGLAGANLQAAFQQPWIIWAFAVLFVLLALSMFGFYELQLPTAWQTRLAAASNRQHGGSVLGVAIMGILSALIVGPCVAPPLAAAVLYIGQTHDPVFGGAALFALSFGMGVPLLAFGTASGRLLPHAGAWMVAIKAVFGVVFLGLAIWMLSRILDPLWIMLMTGALLVGCAIWLGAADRLPHDASGWTRLWKTCGIVCLIAGAAELVGVTAGGRDLLQPLAGLRGGGTNDLVAAQVLPFRPVRTVTDLRRELATAGKPVLLDFYADWCVSCKEMERFTFTDTAVRRELAGFVLLKADVTANNADDQALLKYFGLYGPPATILFGADGVEHRDLRLIGFEKAPEFTARLAKVSG